MNEDKVKVDGGTQTVAQVVSIMDTNLDAYAASVNKIAGLCKDISGCWQGDKASDFIDQFDNFLPNLTIGYNIIEKSRADLQTATNAHKKADEDV